MRRQQNSLSLWRVARSPHEKEEHEGPRERCGGRTGRPSASAPHQLEGCVCSGQLSAAGHRRSNRLCLAGAKLVGALLCAVAIYSLVLLTRAAGPEDCHTASGEADPDAAWMVFVSLAATALGGALLLIASAAETDPSALAGGAMLVFGSFFSGLCGSIAAPRCGHASLWLAVIAIGVGSPPLVAMAVCSAGMVVGLLGLVLYPLVKLCCELCCPALLSKLEGDSI